MSDFRLPAGTLVKHGTSSIHLRSILERGLLPGFGRHHLRQRSEQTPKFQAVYVGELAAYFAAYAAHVAVVKEYVLAMPDFQHKVQMYFSDAGKASREIDVGTIPLSVPVVLNIRLEESVRFQGDEDYLGFDSFSANDSQVWDRWRAGGIERGVPAAWIQSFEFPQLLTTSDYQDRELQAILRADVKCLVWGAISVSERIPQTEISIPSGFNALSQCWTFEIGAIDRFFSAQPISDPSNLFLNQAVQAALVNQVARELDFNGLEFD